MSDLSLLAIAEAKMNPGPRELLFKGCYDVTDTGVSWIAERCPSIVCLNVLVSPAHDTDETLCEWQTR